VLTLVDEVVGESFKWVISVVFETVFMCYRFSKRESN